jgi:FkbM family methyltransferase
MMTKLLSMAWSLFYRAGLKRVSGSVHAQQLWTNIYKASLGGMAYGMDDDAVGTSGEAYALELLAREDGLVVFDVGANVGNYTNLVRARLRERVEIIHAFEPSKRTFERLVDKIGAQRNVHLHNFGMSSTAGELPLEVVEDCLGLTSLYRRGYFVQQAVKTAHETARFETIDGFCEREGIAKIDFLKIDVEGHELDVLRGAQEALRAGRIRIIQWEFGGCAIDARVFFRDFWDLLSDRYVISRIVRDGIAPVDSYSEYWEIFRGSNYLAVSK